MLFQVITTQQLPTHGWWDEMVQAQKKSTRTWTKPKRYQFKIRFMQRALPTLSVYCSHVCVCCDTKSSGKGNKVKWSWVLNVCFNRFIISSLVTCWDTFFCDDTRRCNKTKTIKIYCMNVFNPELIICGMDRDEPRKIHTNSLDTRKFLVEPRHLKAFAVPS